MKDGFVTLGDVPGDLLAVYRWIIGGLVGTITVLAGANAWQWRNGNIVNAARLAERDTLNKALADVNATMRELTDSVNDGTGVTEKLIGITVSISSTLQSLIDRTEVRRERTDRDTERALEALTDVIAEIRYGFGEIKSELRRRP